MGQSAHPGPPAGRVGASTAAFALVVGGLGALLTGCSSPVSSATTTLRGVMNVTVVHTDGETARGVDGLQLRDGDVVRTATGGRAELVTRDRVVYVGSEAAMQVIAGDRQVLRHGAAVVNAQDAPGMSLQVAGLTVNVPDGSAIRAERSVTIRVGTLAGSAEIVSGTGRRLTVHALHQTTVGGDALPDDSTPLRLTDDDGEARTVPELVRDDQTLLGLARGMDSTGQATAQAISQSLERPLPPKPPGADRSERLLPAVIAAAADDADAKALYGRAVDLRRDGGSWGVVAGLIGVRAASVVSALAALEKLRGPGEPPSVQDILDTAGDNGSGGGNGDGNGDGDGSGNGGGGDDNGSGGTPSPTASPSPTDDGGVVGTVTQTVRDVLSLVPTPSPTSSSPAPLISLPGLPVVP